ncbi:MAG: hypothetical protein ACJA01_003838 [Saprospiraceae bacterium]
MVESYRNADGRVCHRAILNIGFIEELLSAEQLNTIARTLPDIYERKESLFTQKDPIINKWVSKLWSQIVASQKLDLTLYDKDSTMIAADTIEHSNVREIGSEWMCYNTW